MDESKEIRKAYESILDHDFAQAIEWFEQAVAQDPGNAEYHYKLSITYARSDKLEKALNHARKAIAIAREHEQYRFHLQRLTARDLVRQAELIMRAEDSRLGDAISLLQQAAAMDPLNVECHLLTGAAYAGLHDFAQAVRSAQEVLRLDPHHAEGAKLLMEYRRKLQ